MLQNFLIKILRKQYRILFSLQFALFCSAFVFFISSPSLAQAPEEIEYRLKAVYLFNFLQFVEWPDSIFENEHSPIILGILGEDPFGKAIDETFRFEKTDSHPIVIKRFKSIDDLTRCQVLFISASEKKISPLELKRISENSVLTISDMEKFGDMGGGIGFFIENKKIRFEINMHALKQANLKVSSKLLRLARIINPL